MIKTDHGYARIYKIYGRPETEIKERLAEVFKQGGGVLVYIRRRGKEIHVLAETKEKDEETAKALTKPVGLQIKKTLGDLYYSTKETETMEEAVVRLLMKYGISVATAESCTGGLAAAKLVNVAGVSDVFQEGFITYSNKAKRKLLGVKKGTLKEHGAVSQETASEMALGAAKAAGTEAAIATTGIAGPDGGTEEKPVGLVYISCAVKGELAVEKCNFRGTRSEVREQAALSVLDLLRRTIQKQYR